VAAQGTLFSTLSKRLNNWVFGILGEHGKASEKPKALRVLNECLKALPTLSHPKVCRPIINCMNEKKMISLNLAYRYCNA